MHLSKCVSLKDQNANSPYSHTPVNSPQAGWGVGGGGLVAMEIGFDVIEVAECCRARGGAQNVRLMYSMGHCVPHPVTVPSLG